MAQSRKFNINNKMIITMAAAILKNKNRLKEKREKIHIGNNGMSWQL